MKMMIWFKYLVALTPGLIFLFAPSDVRATEFYIEAEEPLDPMTLAPDVQKQLGELASGRTFVSLGAAIESGEPAAGDIITLEPGYHRAITIQDFRPEGDIIIRGIAGYTVADSINITSSTNIVVEHMTVYPRNGAKKPTDSVVGIYGASRNIVLRELEIQSRRDASSYTDWSIEDWKRSQVNGIMVRSGSRIEILNNRITGVYHGINTYGEHVLIRSNTIAGHSGDGMRVLGNDTEVRNNTVQDCVIIDGNHPDKIQMWSRGPDGKPGGGILRNIIISGNEFYEWRSPQRSKLPCGTQGVNIFDGRIDGFQITNNVLAVSAYHGISLSGASNGVVANNTVVQPTGQRLNYPWIRMDWGKKGEESHDIVVANNVVGKVVLRGRALTSTKNVEYSGPLDFMSVADQDFRPARRAAHRLADAADPAYAPSVDVRGVPRDGDAGPDIGAFELTGAER